MLQYSLVIKTLSICAADIHFPSTKINHCTSFGRCFSRNSLGLNSAKAFRAAPQHTELQLVLKVFHSLPRIHSLKAWRVQILVSLIKCVKYKQKVKLTFHQINVYTCAIRFLSFHIVLLICGGYFITMQWLPQTLCSVQPEMAHAQITGKLLSQPAAYKKYKNLKQTKQYMYTDRSITGMQLIYTYLATNSEQKWIQYLNKRIHWYKLFCIHLWIGLPYLLSPSKVLEIAFHVLIMSTTWIERENVFYFHITALV